MRKIILLLLTVCFAIRANAQTEPANYHAVADKFKLFYNNNKPDSIYTMFGPEMKAAMTRDQCAAMIVQFRSQLGTIQQTSLTTYDPKVPVAIYKADFQNSPLAFSFSLNKDDKMTGLYFRPITEVPTASTKVIPLSEATSAVDPSVIESPLVLKTLSGTIHGTLDMPKDASGKVPVVIIIAGSGLTDRNGNNKPVLNTDAYKLIAEGLGKSGIASVRYDKRMVGESRSPKDKEVDLRFDDYVDDAVSLINTLVSDDRFSKVIVLGHSEGSLVGMLAAREQPVKAFISLAGAGDQADKIVTQQLKTKPDYIQAEFKTFLDSLRKGKTSDDIDPALYFIARPSIQKYLMSWFRYPPPKVLKSLKIPVLIIQGTTDLQVTVADADKLKKAKSDAVLVIIPGMNHILKEAPEDRDKNLATYTQPDLPLKAELMPAIIDFIKKIN